MGIFRDPRGLWGMRFIANTFFEWMPWLRAGLVSLVHVPVLGNIIQGASVRFMKLIGGAVELMRILYDTGGAITEAGSGYLYRHTCLSAFKLGLEQARLEGRESDYAAQAYVSTFMNISTFGAYGTIVEGMHAGMVSYQTGSTQALEQWVREAGSMPLSGIRGTRRCRLDGSGRRQLYCQAGARLEEMLQRLLQ